MTNSELGIRNLNHGPKTKRSWAGILFRASFIVSLSCLCAPPAFADDSKATVTKNPITVTTIPNPARGKKMTFRVMATGPCRVRIKIYNRFFDPVAKLEKEGERVFDILWSLKNVPEGPYLYQVLVEDKATGQVLKLPQQKFVVLK